MIYLKKNLIIGICGPHESGKDSVLDFISEYTNSHHYFSPIKLTLNTSIVEFLAELFETSTEFILKKKTHPVVRAALEFAGVEYLPKVHTQEFTVDKLRQDIEKYSVKDCGKIFLVSSVYRKFEADFIRQNGILIKVDRVYYRDERRDSYTPMREPLPLERELNSISADFYLNNDNSLERLRRITFDMMTQLEQTAKWKNCL